MPATDPQKFTSERKEHRRVRNSIASTSINISTSVTGISTVVPAISSNMRGAQWKPSTVVVLVGGSCRRSHGISNGTGITRSSSSSSGSKTAASAASGASSTSRKTRLHIFWACSYQTGVAALARRVFNGPRQEKKRDPASYKQQPTNI